MATSDVQIAKLALSHVGDRFDITNLNDATTEALEALMYENHAAGEPLLSALAVSRGAAGLPQRGFFMALRALGRYEGPDQGPEAEAVFLEELELAWDYWALAPTQGPKS